MASALSKALSERREQEVLEAAELWLLRCSCALQWPGIRKSMDFLQHASFSPS
jgi:hypothetical protein